MDLTGKIIAVLDPRGGVSNKTGNSWKSQDFVIEVPGQYPRRCVFTVFGEDRLNQFNIQMGEELTVSFDIDARQWQDKWFNSIRAWKVDRVQAEAPEVQPPVDAAPIPPFNPEPAPFPGNEGGSTDDLPF